MIKTLKLVADTLRGVFKEASEEALKETYPERYYLTAQRHHVKTVTLEFGGEWYALFIIPVLGDKKGKISLVTGVSAFDTVTGHSLGEQYLNSVGKAYNATIPEEVRDVFNARYQRFCESKDPVEVVEEAEPQEAPPTDRTPTDAEITNSESGLVVVKAPTHKKMMDAMYHQIMDSTDKYYSPANALWSIVVVGMTEVEFFKPTLSNDVGLLSKHLGLGSLLCKGNGPYIQFLEIENSHWAYDIDATMKAIDDITPLAQIVVVPEYHTNTVAFLELLRRLDCEVIGTSYTTFPPKMS